MKSSKTTYQYKITFFQSGKDCRDVGLYCSFNQLNVESFLCSNINCFGKHCLYEPTFASSLT